MYLLPKAGVYKYTTAIDKFLYARGFNPSWLRLPAGHFKPITMISADGKQFKEITPEEQEQIVNEYFFLQHPPSYVTSVGSIPIENALKVMTQIAKARIRRYGVDGIYCVNCGTVSLEEFLENVEEPTFIVFYNIEGKEDSVRSLLTYFECLRVVILPTKSPLVTCVSTLKVRPDIVLRF